MDGLGCALKGENMRLNAPKIELLMAEKRLKAGVVARRMGVSQGRFSQIMNEARKGHAPNPWTIGRLAWALRVSVTEIIVNEEERREE